MIAICFGIYLSFTMSSSVHGLRVIHDQHFEPTLLSSIVRPILFEFRDLQYIRYNMELRYILILSKTRKTTLELVGHARLFWITRELRTHISGIC